MTLVLSDFPVFHSPLISDVSWFFYLYPSREDIVVVVVVVVVVMGLLQFETLISAAVYGKNGYYFY